MTIKIADQPILVDVDGEAQCWLDRFLPEATIFRPPQVDLDQYLSGQDGCYNGAFFRSSLPELPKIEIGQIQWPCVGASRYARGLFLVDRVSLFNILNVAWGQAIPGTFPYPIPADWSQTKNRPVKVFLASTAGDGSAYDFSIWMYLLMPIRISDDLWLLPLVDGRYFRLTDCKVNQEINEVAPTKTWQDLFNGFASGAGITHRIHVDYADDAESAMGNPDTVFYDPQVPTPFVVDAACFSIGRRPVVPFPTDAEVDYDFPEDSQLGVVAQKSSDATTIKTATLGNAKVVGGAFGTSRKPRGIRVSTRLSREFFTGTNENYSYRKNLSGSRNGIDLFSKAVWNTIDDETASIGGAGANPTKVAFHSYVDTLAVKLNSWNVEEYYVTIPDLVPVEPGGFDDYIVFEASGSKKTTTIKSLPIDFSPAFFLGQSPSGVAYDSPSNQVKWFRTNNQTCVATVTEEIPYSHVDEGGFRSGVRGKALIHSPSLVVGGVLNRAEVYVIASETTRAIHPGATIHIVWVDDYYTNGAQTHWVVDWAECE